MQDPISRHDIIAMGGNFTVERFDTSNLPGWVTQEGDNINYAHDLLALNGQRLTVEFVGSRYAETNLHVEGVAGYTIPLDMNTFFADGQEQGRKRFAGLIESADPEAATALRVDFRTRQTHSWGQEVPIWSREDLEELGIDKDAGLYVALAKHDWLAVEHYKGMGADVMRPTFEGDCCARLAVANGFASVVDGADQINAKHQRTGETGLHALAARYPHGPLEHLIAHGGDLYAQDNRGRTPLDNVDPRDRKDLMEAIGEAAAAFEQRSLETNTAAAPASYANDDWAPGATQRPTPVESEPAQEQCLMRRRGMRL